MKSAGRKPLAQYLIALGIVDCFRVYYGMGLIAKLLMGILGSSGRAFAISLGLSNLVIYICYFVVILFFYNRITASGDREAAGLYYLWAVMFVLLPLVTLLGLGVLEQSAWETQIMSMEFNYATGWTSNMTVISVYLLCMVLTGCSCRQLRFGVAAILLGVIYFIGWRDALLTLAVDIVLFNNIGLGTVVLTGILLLF